MSTQNKSGCAVQPQGKNQSATVNQSSGDSCGFKIAVTGMRIGAAVVLTMLTGVPTAL